MKIELTQVAIFTSCMLTFVDMRRLNRPSLIDLNANIVAAVYL